MKTWLLFPEAIKQIKHDLQKSAEDWDYLSGVSGEGPIAELEDNLLNTAGGNYAIAMTNATSALLTALIAGGIGKGDEVILPSYTWPQTLSPVILVGATPVFADIEDRSYSISVKAVEKLITGKTKAIIAVHLYGIPADVVRLEKLCNEYNCLLICDAAQGFGSFVYNKPIGSYGDFVALSFGRSKLLSAGEGGALICKKRELYEKAIIFSQHPLRAHKDVDDIKLRTLIDGISMNFRMHPLVASVTVGQLKGLMHSNYLEKLCNNFMTVYNTIKASEINFLLPVIYEGVLPSGICLPLILNDQNDLNKCNLTIRQIGMEAYEGGLQNALHLSVSIQNRRFSVMVSNSGKKLFPRHRSHIKGSCPNTEKRINNAQVFVKMT